MTAHVLVVDDDPLICKGLKFNLEQAGYQVIIATNSLAAIEQASHQRLDAAILDIGLPGKDGLGLCRHLKEHHNLPVIFLTARRRELDEIIGLEIGADDYITKPFNIDVLLAHLKAVLRRAASNPVRSDRFPPPLEAGDFTITPLTHQVTKGRVSLTLAPREFDLLYFFLSHPEQVFSTDEIIEGVWGAEYLGEPQVLYVQIRSLREKIENKPSQPEHLLTLRGVGYKFVP